MPTRGIFHKVVKDAIDRMWPPWNACAEPHHQSNFRQPWVAVWAFLDLISMAQQILAKVGFLLTYLGNNKVVTEVTFVLQNSEQI